MARAARQTSIDPNQIQIIHVFNRCVRRAYLCGQDPLTGRDFEHRKEWARRRLEHLASLFAIDCLTFAIMSNHTHQVLRSRPDIVATWEDREVAMRWLNISPRKDTHGNPRQPTESEVNMLLNNPQLLARIRVRLSDVSWWMRYFSQHLAVRANKEDDVTGHFWESRFGSKLLEDEASILACMIYVDLNPVRAGIAATPEESDFTGAKERIDDLRITIGTSDAGNLKLEIAGPSVDSHAWERLDNENSGWLCPIEIDERNDPIGPDPEPSDRRPSRKGVMPISLIKYLELLDWTGRTIRSDKRGAIPVDLESILKRIGLTPREFAGRVRQTGNLDRPIFPKVKHRISSLVPSG